MKMMHEQEQVLRQVSRVVEIFSASEGIIRPHFFLTGPSGSGKTYISQQLAKDHDLELVEINAAQLTKEGTAGNSLSKALKALERKDRLTICLVDEFDKLIISGNSNSSVAHEVTLGVQNEFLKVLESKTASVYDDYGKYKDIAINNVLFIFAGAFNGESNIGLDRLREMGVKTEFLGRVGLIYNIEKPSLESIKYLLRTSPILHTYLDLFTDAKKENVVKDIMKVVEPNYKNNTLGARMLTTLIHQYFINGGEFNSNQVKATTFQNTLKLKD